VLSFVVDDVDAVHADAERRGLSVVAPPRNLFYGQRQLLLSDPNGALIDISTPTEPSEEFTASLVQDGGTVVCQADGTRALPPSRWSHDHGN
jgi:hypothetical protein